MRTKSRLIIYHTEKPNIALVFKNLQLIATTFKSHNFKQHKLQKINLENILKIAASLVK